MVQRNDNVDYFRGPGSPGGRARISTGRECPGAPVKASRRNDGGEESPSQYDPMWQMNYLSDNSSAARSPRRPVPRQLFPIANDFAQVNNNHHEVNEEARPVGRRLFADEPVNEIEDDRNGVVEQPQPRQRQPVARGGAAIVTPLREDASK